MNIRLREAHINELPVALKMFKQAATRIAKKKIDHWQYWHNPPEEKVHWVREGFLNKQFFFIENTAQETIGMIRIMNEDITYWGAKNDQALYVHSLVIAEGFKGLDIGKQVLGIVEYNALSKGCVCVRLDCSSDNLALCSYYEEYGFKKVGSTLLLDASFNLYEKRLHSKT